MKRIVLAGGSGFLGQALAGHFDKAGWEVVVLTRSPQQTASGNRQVAWNSRTLGPWTSELDGAVAVVNLTGRSVNCRYDARHRTEIMDSRVFSTRIVGEAVAACVQPPRVWLNSSTATLYKHSLDRPMDETCEVGATPEAEDVFSIEVGLAWERALAEAGTPQTRKIALRTSMVLGLAENSVFPMLRRLVRFGLGGQMGSGKQYVSWIHETDVCRAVEWIIEHDAITGPVNVTAPNLVPNREMMQILREVCGVPFGLPATKWMLEIGAFLLRTETELILKSRRAVPGRLLESGFQFQFPLLRGAFEDLAGGREAKTFPSPRSNAGQDDR